MEPVRKKWDRQYVRKALELSRESWDESLAHGTRSTSTRKLFLIGGSFSSQGGTILVESEDTGEKWGKNEFMVDLWRAADEQLWLERAASFGGSLYLVDLITYLGNDKKVQSLWSALRRRAGSSSPHSLFILSNLYETESKSAADFVDSNSSAAEDLLSTLQKMSPHVQKVVVCRSHFPFERDPRSHARKIGNRPILLHTLHLEGVVVNSGFLHDLSSGLLFHVYHTLSLIHLQTAIDQYRFSDLKNVNIDNESEWIRSLHPSRFLGWKLRHLNLEGFFSSIDLTSFMNNLGKCPHKTLCSLSLRGSIKIFHSGYISSMEVPANPVGVVVDALHKSGLQFLDLGGFEQDPTIQAQLLRNRHSAPNHQISQYSKVPAVAMRLFTCGDAYAGKTTLLSTLSADQYWHSRTALNKLKAVLTCQSAWSNTLERTRGIQIHTIARYNVRLSVWDMAGETEFHAFHDHMFPDPSASHGSPSMFMFVWSPMESKDEKEGKSKTQHDFEASFRYWLKFITSKTRQSNVRRKLFVVITRKDQTNFVRDAMEASIHALSTTFSSTIEVVDVLEVDARSEASVKPLASSIFRTARDVLEGVKVYSICSQVSEHLSKRHKQNSSVGSEQPIISWNDFSNLCSIQFDVVEPEVQKAIAYSLNESGDIIHLSNLPFLVLDPNWFCNEVMGSLIHFPHPGTSRVILPINGYMKQDYLEKLLKESSHSTVEGSVLLALMEAMHLCCRVPGERRGMVFIPAILLESSSSTHLQWRGAVSGRPSTQVYVGRRLECDKKDLTFLTPGLFPTIQVVFNKAFYEKANDKKLGKADVQPGKGFMCVCMQENEILVEWGLANGEHVIDVMMRAPDDEDAGYTLAYMEEKIIKTVIALCAQPEGNQGVRLVEAVIRPDCLHSPSPLHMRPCALIFDLKQELKEQLEGGRRHEKLLHLWDRSSSLPPVVSHFMDLLGPKEFMQVLRSYKASLEQVFLMSHTLPPRVLMEKNLKIQSASSSGPGSHDNVGGRVMMQGDDATASTTAPSRSKNLEKVGDDTQVMQEWITEESSEVKVDENEQVVDALGKSMVDKLLGKMQSIDGKVVGLQQSVNSMHKEIGTKVDVVYRSIEDLRSHALPKVQSLVEQSLNFALENEAGKVPRFVFLTTDDRPGIRRKMVTTLLRGLKNVRIELFCEHREQPHRVDGQIRFSVSTVDDGKMIKQALPYVNGFLKVLTLASKVGAHVLAGAGSTIPDFSQLVALAVDTPGFLDNQGFLAKTSSSPKQDFNGWRQWLVSVLEKKGGMNESNIESKFMLRRALYEDTSKVAWLCGMHYKDQCPLPLV